MVAASWSPEAVARIIALRATHTASEVVREIGHGLTRNMVCGIWGRAKERGVVLAPPVRKAGRTPPDRIVPPGGPALAPHAWKKSAPTPKAPVKKREARVVPAKPMLPIEPVPEPIAAPDYGDGKPFDELTHGQCRFAITGHAVTPGEHRFCAAPALEEKPYCAFHHGIAYTKTPKRAPRSQSVAHWTMVRAKRQAAAKQQVRA